MENRNVIEISSGTIWRILLIILGVVFIYAIKDILMLFFLALVVVSAATPIVDRLERKKIPRTISTILLFAGLLVVVGYFISLIIPVISHEFAQLAKNLPSYLDNITSWFDKINKSTSNYNFEIKTENLLDNFSQQVSNSGGQIFSNTVSFLGSFFSIFIVFSLSFYMLVKKDAIGGFLKSITPSHHESYVVDLASRIQYKMGRWLVGQGALILLIFGLDYLALTVLQVPYALILALLGGLLEIIPYIGPTIALIPAALVGLTVSPLTALLVIFLYIFIQQLENYVIAPLVMRKAVGLNPVAVILALLIGAKLAGILGVILAVPVATGIGVFLGDILDNKQGVNLIDQ